MYTIQTLTHIVSTDNLQALIKFSHNGNDELTTALISVAECGNGNLNSIYGSAPFVNAVNIAIAAKKQIIDNPIVD